MKREEKFLQATEPSFSIAELSKEQVDVSICCETLEVSTAEYYSLLNF